MIGKKFGQYTISSVIGDGGMGTVYKGINNNLNQEVAIKVLHPHLARNESLVVRFEKEAHIQAKLTHPNIVTVNDFFRQGEVCGIVMEHIRGYTFDQLLAQNGGPLPVQRVIQLFAPLLNALNFAHSNNVIHRDIKPGNLILQDLHGMQVPKIMDFGIARAMNDSKRLTATGTKMGTLDYMSPEQCQVKDNIDFRTDIYSMAVSMYEMLTGHVPFSHESDFELMKMIVTQPPPPPSRWNPQVPQWLEAVILTAMAKEPGRRFASAAVFVKALSGPASRPPVTPPPIRTPPPTPPPDPFIKGYTIPDIPIERPTAMSTQTRNLILGIVGIVAVVVVALAVIFGGQKSSTQTTSPSVAEYSSATPKPYKATPYPSTPTPTPPPAPSGNSSTPAVNAVQEYYNAINNRNAAVALSKRYNPSASLENTIRDLVIKNDFCHLQEAREINRSGNTAWVYIKARSKSRDSSAQMWCGNLEMINTGYDWKIKSMKGLSEKNCN